MLNQKSNVKIVQDMDKTISVMYNAGKWLEESGRNPSDSWKPSNMNKAFMLKHAEPSEFYVAIVKGQPAAGMILQDNERNQSWKAIDKDKHVNALYVHWLCVARPYAGTGLPKIMLDFAASHAKSRGIHILRLDTNANETKLRQIYESLGFDLVSTEAEADRITAFFQKKC
jgi:GNAT superfamily N-acetyltransferase